jgi:thiamine kinase-like enzyme
VSIKIYLGQYERQIQSLEREVASLNFLLENGFKSMSSLIAFSKKNPSICYEWIEGETPKSNTLVKDEIVQALIFLKNLYERTSNFPLAIDSFCSATDLVNQIRTRISLGQFYLNRYPKILNTIEEHLKINSKNLPVYSKFPINTYSFSDIGPHNMIINPQSKIYFLDFEFFGADSKVKMIADLVSRPKSFFNKNEIFSLMKKLSMTDLEIQQTVYILPINAIKWSLITARRLSGEVPQNHTSTKVILEQINCYLGYSNFLRRVTKIEEILTFTEFKEMRL